MSAVPCRTRHRLLTARRGRRSKPGYAALGRRWKQGEPITATTAVSSDEVVVSAAGPGIDFRGSDLVPLPCLARLSYRGLPPARRRAGDEYVRCFNEKTIRGSCGDYRVAATIDCDLDTADLDPQAQDADPGGCGETAAAWASGSPIRSVFGGSARRMSAARRCRAATM
jgi:hypothetical protein